MFKFGKGSNKVLSTVSKYHQLCTNRMMKKTVIDISLPEWAGRRDCAYQNGLYLKKWSKADGYIKKSKHQILDKDGLCIAVDHSAYVDGEQNWNQGRLTYIGLLYIQCWEELKKEGKIPKNLYIHWGGFWKSKKDYKGKSGMGWDLPHKEIRNYPQKIKLI